MPVVFPHLSDWLLLLAGFLPFWVLLRLPRRPHRLKRELLLLLFAAVLLFIAAQTLTRQPSGFCLPLTPEEALHRWQHRLGVSLRPGFTIRNFLQYGSPQLQQSNLLGNVLLFLPLGLLLPPVHRRWRSGLKTAVFCAALSCSIEFVQLFLPRSVDVDDVLLNTLGAVLGWLLWLICSRIARIFQKKA